MSVFDLAAERVLVNDVERLDDYITDFDSWVRSHATSLRRTAFLLTGDRQLAEDLVQTALAKVSTRWSRVVAGGDPLPYVRTVLARTATGWRRRRWTGEVPTEELPLIPENDFAVRIADHDAMLAWLRELPARQRAVIVLRFYEDLTEAQTAELLGCTVGTVKSHTARALAALRMKVEHANAPNTRATDPHATDPNAMSPESGAQP